MYCNSFIQVDISDSTARKAKALPLGTSTTVACFELVEG